MLRIDSKLMIGIQQNSWHDLVKSGYNFELVLGVLFRQTSGHNKQRGTIFVDNVRIVLRTNVKSWHNWVKPGHDFERTYALFKVSFFMF